MVQHHHFPKAGDAAPLSGALIGEIADVVGAAFKAITPKMIHDLSFGHAIKLGFGSKAVGGASAQKLKEDRLDARDMKRATPKAAHKPAGGRPKATSQFTAPKPPGMGSPS